MYAGVLKMGYDKRSYLGRCSCCGFVRMIHSKTGVCAWCTMGCRTVHTVTKSEARLIKDLEERGLS